MRSRFGCARLLWPIGDDYTSPVDYFGLLPGILKIGKLDDSGDLWIWEGLSSVFGIGSRTYVGGSFHLEVGAKEHVGRGC